MEITATGSDALPKSAPEGSGASFSFTPLPSVTLPALAAAEAKDSLQKWNLEPFMRSSVFRFDQPFSPEMADAFLSDFFGSPAVQEAAPVCTGPGQWSTLGTVAPGAVKHTRLSTTVLRLDFFDRLKDEGIVRGSDIAKCFDVQCGEVLVSDKLRLLLLDESSDEWDVYSAAERKELIFHVMKRLAVGGGMNQYDDTIEPYLQLTKALYKDLVTVNKNASGALQVSSHTFAIESVNGSSASLFSRPSAHNFCYVCVDPIARHVKVWYAAWFPML